jgi:hypothetical protein
MWELAENLMLLTTGFVVVYAYNKLYRWFKPVELNFFHKSIGVIIVNANASTAVTNAILDHLVRRNGVVTMIKPTQKLLRELDLGDGSEAQQNTDFLLAGTLIVSKRKKQINGAKQLETTYRLPWRLFSRDNKLLSAGQVEQVVLGNNDVCYAQKMAEKLVRSIDPRAIAII